MAFARRWLDPTTLRQLRYLVAHGDPHAIRAARQLERYRKAASAPARRDAKRAFERHACRALGWDLKVR